MSVQPNPRPQSILFPSNDKASSKETSATRGRANQRERNSCRFGKEGKAEVSFLSERFAMSRPRATETLLTLLPSVQPKFGSSGG